MSVLKTNAAQIGQSITTTNNFTLYQPASPDGTVRLGNGNAGSVTDLVTLTSSGNVGIGTSSPVGISGYTIATINNATNGAGVYLQQAGNSVGRILCTSTDMYVGGTLSNSKLLLQSNGVVQATLDSSGNLGLGVTPSAWYSGWKAVEIGAGNAVWTVSNQDFRMSSNLYNDGSNSVYKANGYATFYNQQSGTHKWYTAPSGTAGNAISFTQAMTLDASGNLGIGTGSPLQALDLVGNARITGNVFIRSANYLRLLEASNNNAYDILNNANNLTFVYNSAERMRIDSSGNLLVGTTSGNYQISTLGTTFNAAKLGLLTTGRSGGDYPSVGYNTRYTSTNASYTYDNTDTASMIRFSVGQIQTFTAPTGTAGAAISYTTGPYVAQGGTSWTNSSDERLKDIIEPIENAVSKTQQLRAVIGKFKTDPEDTRRSFLIAQDVQKVLPEAVDASNPEALGVQYTDVIPLLVAAIQEQQEQINQLKAEVAALKGVTK